MKIYKIYPCVQQSYFLGFGWKLTFLRPLSKMMGPIKFVVLYPLMVTVIRSTLAACFLLLFAGPVFGQLSGVPEKAILKSIEKKKWEKAQSQLRKALNKDSANTLALYVSSIYYFQPDNPAYHLDSAYRYVLKSLTAFPLSSGREREKMKKIAVDSALLVLHRHRVDTAIFEAVRKVNTEEAYITFLSQHPYSAQRGEAEALRDEVAYLKALAENTFEGFQVFMEKYPHAQQIEQARRNYDRLLFESKTRDKRLSSFQTFLREYPATPFRAQVEKDIFELYTLSGEPERFLSYTQAYPATAQARQAKNILFHLLQHSDAGDNVSIILGDSLERIRVLNASYLVPFLKNRHFGFMDQHGNEVIRPALKQLNDEYKCGAITEDVIIADNRLLARDGSTVFRGKVSDVEDLGSGFLKINSDGCLRVIHKSGFSIDSCVQQAKVIGNRFLALRKLDKWELVSLTGRNVLPESAENMELIGQMLAVTRGSKTFLVTIEELMAMADEQKFSYDYEVSAVKILPNRLLHVNAQGKDIVINSNFDVIVPAAKQIKPAFFGYQVETDSAWLLYDQKVHPSEPFNAVDVSEPWVFVRKGRHNFIFDTERMVVASKGYDSLKLKGPFAIGKNGDTLDIHLRDTLFLRFIKPVSTTFLPGKDSVSFLIVDADSKKTIYDNRGVRYFTEKPTQYEKIQYAGDGLFIVGKKDKKGLIDSKGQPVIPIEYDAIGSVSDGGVSMLKNMKFGYYDVASKKLIKPQYEKNVNRFNRSFLTAFKEGYYGFIDIQNKPAGKFEFQEIRYWNDSLAWVKKEGNWMMIDVYQKKVVHADIRQFTMIRDAADEKLAIVRQKDFYGVLSNTRGVVIPITFTDLVNIGSADEPLYFTEKHVSEASIFVVIYYDENGKFLRREVYEDADDYELIYCADN